MASSIQDAIGQGVTSENFDLGQNLARGDDRGVDPAARVMQQIMQERGCSFDDARLIYNQRKMAEAGIDPATGLSTDPKAANSPEEFNEVFTPSFILPPPGNPVMAKVEKFKKWWAAQVGFFGLGMGARHSRCQPANCIMKKPPFRSQSPQPTR